MVWSALSTFHSPVSGGGGNGVWSGIYVPSQSLPGITAGDLYGPGAQSRAAFAILNGIYAALQSRPNTLGIATNKTQVGVGVPDQLRQTLFFSFVHWVQSGFQGGISMLPPPASGAGRLQFIDVFPNAYQVGDGQNLPGAGVILRLGQAYLERYALKNSGDWYNDARALLSQVLTSMVLELDLSSAIVAKQRLPITAITPPPNYTGVGAITGLTSSDLETSNFYATNFSVTVQLKLNQQNQTFDLL